MERSLTGRFTEISSVGGEICRAFIPDPLPPSPPLKISDSLQSSFDQAHLSIGRLDSVSTLLPDIELFLFMYTRKEAVLSSQIEGTQSSLSDLLLFEDEARADKQIDDVKEVSNYVAAMEHGLKRLREGFPLSLRLIREVHALLLREGRGSGKEPGSFRRSQNWIGGSRPGNAAFIPPPPHELMSCLGDFEKFLHDIPNHHSPLIKCALSHVQFETIHPFLDGTGRLGRLLISLILCNEKILKEPLLYLSLYFKSHRQEYYDLLQLVRTKGDWEAWLAFFATGVKETAQQAVDTAQRLVKMFSRDAGTVFGLGRSGSSAANLLQAMQRKPIGAIARYGQMTKLTPATVAKAMYQLIDLGLVREITGRRRDMVFCYDEYLNILSEGTEPL